MIISPPKIKLNFRSLANYCLSAKFGLGTVKVKRELRKMLMRNIKYQTLVKKITNASSSQGWKEQIEQKLMDGFLVPRNAGYTANIWK